jgi:hypothetical protein
MRLAAFYGLRVTLKNDPSSGDRRLYSTAKSEIGVLGT